MAANDPYIGLTSAGTKNRSGSTIGTNTYTEFAPYNTARSGFTIENISNNDITVRFGLSGVEYVISPKGSLSRYRKSGAVPSHSIWIKSAAGGDAFVFEEN